MSHYGKIKNAERIRLIDEIVLDVENMVIEVKGIDESWGWAIYPPTPEGVIYELEQLKNLFRGKETPGEFINRRKNEARRKV